MDGIVIWSDTNAHKAIVWCSDNGDLAFAEGLDVLTGSFLMPEAGTMVAVKTRSENGLRSCYELTPLYHNAAPDLPQSLRDLARSVVA